jgi:hypothetical protein
MVLSDSHFGGGPVREEANLARVNMHFHSSQIQRYCDLDSKDIPGTNIMAKEEEEQVRAAFDTVNLFTRDLSNDIHVYLY